MEPSNLANVNSRIKQMLPQVAHRWSCLVYSNAKLGQKFATKTYDKNLFLLSCLTYMKVHL